MAWVGPGTPVPASSRRPLRQLHKEAGRGLRVPELQAADLAPVGDPDESIEGEDWNWDGVQCRSMA